MIYEVDFFAFYVLFKKTLINLAKAAYEDELFIRLMPPLILTYYIILYILILF